MQARRKGNSSGMCVWQMQSTSLTHQQEGARVVLANTDCCDQVGFLPLAAVFTSSTTHQCPTARESNPSLTPLTQSPFPLATAMFRDSQPRRSSSALTKATTQSPAAPTLMGMGLSLWIHSWKN